MEISILKAICFSKSVEVITFNEVKRNKGFEYIRPRIEKPFLALCSGQGYSNKWKTQSISAAIKSVIYFEIF